MLANGVKTFTCVFFYVVFILKTEECLLRANKLQLLVRLSEYVMGVIVVLIYELTSCCLLAF